MKSLTPYVLFLSALIFIGAGCQKSSPQPAPAVLQEQTTQEENPSNEQPIAPAENPDEQKNNSVDVNTEVKTEVKTIPPVTSPKPTEQSKPVVSAAKEFNMTAKNWDFEPSNITVKKGDTVKLHIKSVDVDHGFTLSAFGVSKTLKPGETVTVEFVADKVGNHSFFCSVFCGAGHKEMRGTLTVTE